MRKKRNISCVYQSNRVTRQFKENIRMESNIIPKERERNAANERDIHAQVQREALNHNLTADEIEYAYIVYGICYRVWSNSILIRLPMLQKNKHSGDSTKWNRCERALCRRKANRTNSTKPSKSATCWCANWKCPFNTRWTYCGTSATNMLRRRSTRIPIWRCHCSSSPHSHRKPDRPAQRRRTVLYYIIYSADFSECIV